MVLRMEERSEERDGGGGGAARRGIYVVARVLEEDAVEMAGRIMGEEGDDPEAEAVRETGYEGGGVDLCGAFVAEFGRSGNLGGVKFRLAMAFSQSRVISRSVAGLTRDGVETSS